MLSEQSPDVKFEIGPDPITATPADNRRANVCWFLAKKRSWTFESSDARNEQRNGGNQKKNSAGNFTDDYKLTVTRLGTVVGKGQRKRTDVKRVCWSFA